MRRIPADAGAVLDLIRELPSFTGWDRKTTLSIVEVKTYCVPGNDPRAKGHMAVWVKSPKAKRARILFPEVVLLAMRFIADPEARSSNQYLCPREFTMTIRHAGRPEQHLPGLHQNDSIYLALARRLLGLPDDYQDEITLQRRAAFEQRQRASRPNIRTIDGLMQDVVLAYAEAMVECDPSEDQRHWPDIAFRALWRRHSRASWYDQRLVLQEHLQGTYDEVLTDPGHEDIRSIEIAVFAALYTNGLALTGAIRASAITMVVNHLADASDDGVFAGLPTEIERLRHKKERYSQEAGAALDAELRRLAQRGS